MKVQGAAALRNPLKLAGRPKLAAEATRRRYQSSRLVFAQRATDGWVREAPNEFRFRASHLRHGSAPARRHAAISLGPVERPAAAEDACSSGRQLGSAAAALGLAWSSASRIHPSGKKTPVLFHKSNIKLLAGWNARSSPSASDLSFSIHCTTLPQSGVTGRVILIVGRFYNTCSNADHNHPPLQIRSFK